MDRIEIDPAPENVAAMMERGQFHSHQDGRWRFSPYGGETVHVNDPTERFEARAEFGKGVAAAVCRAAGLFARIHHDGTRGLLRWESSVLRLWDHYGPRDEHERAQREWIEAAFTAPLDAAQDRAKALAHDLHQEVRRRALRRAAEPAGGLFDLTQRNTRDLFTKGNP